MIRTDIPPEIRQEKRCDMATERREMTRDEALRETLEQMSAENQATTDGIRVDIVHDDTDAPRELVWKIA
jgi:hypothetical protein